MSQAYLFYSEMILNRWALLMVRALLILGPMVLIFWILKPTWTHRFRIHQPREAKNLWKEEWPRAVLSLSLYMLPVFCVAFAAKEFGYSKVYLDINEYGMGYFIGSIFVFAFFIDTWFYWAHRLMHTNEFLKKVHNVHHRSYNVTPVTSYSFNIVEGVINMMPYWVILFLIPWHPLALFIFSLFGIFYIGYIHLGYDFGYSWRRDHPILKWFYSSTHHSIHHQRYDGNFAVYFTFWDKLMGTEIEAEIEKVKKV